MIKHAIAHHIPTYEVETELIVPIEKASDKREYAARTLRPKLLRQVEDYLDDCDLPPLEVSPLDAPSFADGDVSEWLSALNVDTSIQKSPYFQGGEPAALKQLDRFIESRLCQYDQSNDPALDLTSKLSPYLHFGQLSAVYVYQRVAAELDRCGQAVEAFLEQLLIRRELAFNFIYYTDGYDRFETMTERWAYQTMDAHREDRRTTLYTVEDYIHFKTHDPYFNAAMKEMVLTGYMHNYMRMYWGKKIIEWSLDYESAYNTILYLNNAYFIDGRDPNGYTGIAWLFGRHDRPWGRRDVFGSLRFMNAAGLKRKFAIDDYVTAMNRLSNT